MKKLAIALVAAVALASQTADAASDQVALTMTVTASVNAGNFNPSFDLNWNSSSVSCGQFKLGTNAGAALWYDAGYNTCPTPVAAEAFLTETQNGGSGGDYAFHVTVTDSQLPNNAGQATLHNVTDPNHANAWIVIGLVTTVDGNVYNNGDAVFPANGGFTSFIQINPYLISSSAGGCYNYGDNGVTPNSCGHAMVAPTPGDNTGNSGQPEGYYSGTARVVVYL